MVVFPQLSRTDLCTDLQNHGLTRSIMASAWAFYTTHSSLPSLPLYRNP